PIPNGINVSRHDNGDRARLLLGGPCRDWTPCDNDVNPEPDQLGRILPEPLDVSRTPPVLYADVLSLDITHLAETLHESRAVSGTGAGYEGEIRDPGDGPWPLRCGGKRHREQTQAKCDDSPDGAVPHCRLLAS